MNLLYLHGFATTPEVRDGQPKGNALNLDFENLEEESQKVVASADPGSILVGWSMGGMVAIRSAILAPKKFKALILVSSTPKFIESDGFPHGISHSLLLKLRQQIRKDGIDAFHRLVFKKQESKGKKTLASHKIDKELKSLEDEDLREYLKELETPTLIIHGKKDQICLPGAAHFLKEQIYNSELFMMEDTGHAPHIENSSLFNARLGAFMDKHAV